MSSSARDLEAFRSAEHAGWQAKVAAYDRYWSPLTTALGAQLLDAVGVGAGTRVLDVACGPGRVAAAAAARGADAVGVDFSDRMVAHARGLFPALDIRHAEAEFLPFADDSFDAVIVNFGVHHFSRPDFAMVEAQRVLKPGGRLGFTLWAGPADHVGLRIMFDAIEAHGRVDAPLPEGPPQFLFTEPRACATLLTTAGFDGPSIEHRLVRTTWRLPAPDGLFAAYADGAVRIALLLAAQKPEALAAIRTAVSEACRTYAVDGEVHIPLAAEIVTAQRL
ncbi:MAG: class I SAM-dependent methyltransferase [Dongiaceae bacterium]